MPQASRARRQALQEINTVYSQTVSEVLEANLKFWEIYNHNVEITKHLHNNFDEMFGALESGVIVIEEALTLEKYLACYGGYHYYKLRKCFSALLPLIPAGSNIEILDYGCGQAFASTLFYDFMLENNLSFNVRSVTLIEPSDLAIKRGVLHLNPFINHTGQVTEIKVVTKLLDDLINADIATDNQNIKIHLFSNILDIDTINLEVLANKIKATQRGRNYFVSTGTYHAVVLERMLEFKGHFENASPVPCHSGKIESLVYSITSRTWEPRHGVKMYLRIFYCDF